MAFFVSFLHLYLILLNIVVNFLYISLFPLVIFKLFSNFVYTILFCINRFVVNFYVMRSTGLSFLFIILLFFVGCSNKNRSAEVASYKYEEEKIAMNAELRAKVPEWVEEGKICYGLVVQVDNKTRRPVKGKPVKAKVVQIHKNYVKMKALERVSLIEVEGCDKMGLSKGQTWDEKQGDFYLTREDAIEALKKMNIYRIKTTDRVTVD